MVNGFLLNRGRAACYVAGVTNAVAPAAASEDEKSDDGHDEGSSLWKKTLKIQTILLRIRDVPFYHLAIVVNIVQNVFDPPHPFCRRG